MSGEEEDTNWILDGIVNLLGGPVWSVPILTFIEHNSITFEPEEAGGGEDEAQEEEEEEEPQEEEEDADQESGEKDHRRIHKDYKRLVDFLLNSFMEDLCVTPEQLEQACSQSSISTPFQKSLFEQIWAADDYKTFKMMMIQKNLELQLQALEMLQYRYGVDMRGREGEREGESDGARREREILEEVYRLSREEHEQLRSLQDQESRDMEIAIARSIQDEKRRLEKALRRPKTEEEGEEAEEEEEEAEEEEVAEEEFGKGRVLPPIKSKGSEIDEEDLKRRQEYLKQQRDRLLEMKKRERERRLENFETTEPNRPQSSRAARTAMGGAAAVDPKTLAVRRALAERLKAEVIKED